MLVMTQAPEKPKEKEPQVDKLVQCPRCEAIFHESELVVPRHDEFPRVLYKTAEVKPAPETPNLDYKTVNSEDELKKAEGEGWSKEIPKPKDAKPEPKPAEPPPHKGAK